MLDRQESVKIMKSPAKQSTSQSNCSTVVRQSESRPPDTYLTEADILVSPMDDCHKELAIMHFRRIKRIAWTDPDADEHWVPLPSPQKAAKEQLSRMTIVIRGYASVKRRRDTTVSENSAEVSPRWSRDHEDEEDNNIESMIADLTDAALYMSSRRGTFSQPLFANPLPSGQEQELVALTQSLLAGGNADDVIELWNIPYYIPTQNPLPDRTATVGEDLGRDIDWTNQILKHSISEDNLIAGIVATPWDANATYADASVASGRRIWHVVRDRQGHKEGLKKRVPSRNDLSWPPPSWRGKGRRSRATTVTRLPEVDWTSLRWEK